MIEGQQGEVDIQDVRKPVFQALLYFTYTDQLPEVLPATLPPHQNSFVVCITTNILLQPLYQTTFLYRTTAAAQYIAKHLSTSLLHSAFVYSLRSAFQATVSG